MYIDTWIHLYIHIPTAPPPCIFSTGQATLLALRERLCLKAERFCLEACAFDAQRSLDTAGGAAQLHQHRAGKNVECRCMKGALQLLMNRYG